MQRLTAVLNLFGYLCLVFAVLGGVLGAFDRQLVIAGAKMGKMDVYSATAVAIIGGVALGISWLINRRNKAQ